MATKQKPAVRCPDCNGSVREAMIVHVGSCPVLGGLAADTYDDATWCERTGKHWRVRECSEADRIEFRAYRPDLDPGDFLVFLYFDGAVRHRRFLSRDDVENIRSGGDPR